MRMLPSDNFIKVFVICCFTQITYIIAAPSRDDLAKVVCPEGRSICYPYGLCCKIDEEFCSSSSGSCEPIFTPGQNKTEECCEILKSEDEIENDILNTCLKLLARSAWKECCNNARSSPAAKSCPPEFISCYSDTCCDPSLHICSIQSQRCVPVFRAGENEDKLCCETMTTVDTKREGLLQVCSHRFSHRTSGCQAYSRPGQVQTNPECDDSTWKTVAIGFIVIVMCSLFFCIGRFSHSLWNKFGPKREIRVNKSQRLPSEEQKLLKKTCDQGTETSPESAGQQTNIPPVAVTITLPEGDDEALYSQGNESTNKQMHDDKFNNAMKNNSSSSLAPSSGVNRGRQRRWSAPGGTYFSFNKGHLRAANAVPGWSNSTRKGRHFQTPPQVPLTLVTPLAPRDPASAQFINNNNPTGNTHRTSHNVQVGESTDTHFDNVKHEESRCDISIATQRGESKGTEFDNEKHGDYRYGISRASVGEPTDIEIRNPMHGDSTNAISSDLQEVLTSVQFHNVKHGKSTNDTSNIALQGESAENREKAFSGAHSCSRNSSCSLEVYKGQENDKDIAK